MIKCTNCNKELITEHSFCPNCGTDLRQAKALEKADISQKVNGNKTSILNRLGSPKGAIWISFFIGTIIMEMHYGFYRYFTSPNANIGSLIGKIVGSGAGFLIVVLIPSLTISLIIYAIKKKFPRDEFATLVYVFTILASIFFLSTLF